MDKENKINLEIEKFGTHFKTKDGSHSILGAPEYLENSGYGEYIYPMLIETGEVLYYNKEGRAKCVNRCFDVVSRYQEPINEDKLTKYVNDYISENHSIVSEDSEFQYAMNIAVAKAYNVAYRKAKEE